MASPLPKELDVPIFPLPGVVLFPGTLLPLRIFEPRYVQLLKDAMTTDKLIGMAHIKPGMNFSSDSPEAVPPEVYPTLGVGTIVADQANADGTFHIALLGQARCRIVNEIPHKPYRIARVATIDDRTPAKQDDERRLRQSHDAMLDLSRKLISKTLEGDASEQLKTALGERRDAGAVADLLASVYVQDAALRQTLLETTDLLARVRLLQAALERLWFRLEPAQARYDYRHDDVSLN
jgi:uncharacterized protein